MSLTPYQQRRAEREALMAASSGKKVGSRRVFNPEVAKARASEKSRRYMEARRRDTTLLLERHAEEYKALAAVEAEGARQERGPLPGDVDYQEES